MDYCPMFDTYSRKWRAWDLKLRQFASGPGATTFPLCQKMIPHLLACPGYHYADPLESLSFKYVKPSLTLG